MDLYQALMTTRAMRRFTDEPVGEEDVWACLRAAVQAPSGGNIQPYQFLVVTDPALRSAIGELYLRAWERYAPAVAKVTPPFEEARSRRPTRPAATSATCGRATTWPTSCHGFRFSCSCSCPGSPWS